MHPWVQATLLTGVGLLGATALASAEPIEINGQQFDSWPAYTSSEFFQENGMRCGARPVPQGPGGSSALAGPGDCDFQFTDPLPSYDPGAPFVIDVVVHVITNSSGTQGVISDAMVQTGIDILNEDFQAMAGTNGENGNIAEIQFRLAPLDPLGNPTTGITNSANNTWFNDGGSYYNSLNWDPNRYMNVYTNTAGGFLGYVPDLPQGGGLVGSAADRVVVLWSSYGRNAPIGPPYDQGRTLTHEVGHYLGLWHTFDNGCGTSSCYTTGDYLCDTNKESSPTFDCPVGRTTCSGTPAPIENYMDYSDDLCMELFTVEQVRRMRCTLEHWRPGLSPFAVDVREAQRQGGLGLLSQNEPNPFRADTRIQFELPASGPVSLEVLDVSGRHVRTLLTGSRAAGTHSLRWNGRTDTNDVVSAGVYFYRLQTERGSETRRIVKID